jgi:hypothetical protein
MNSHIPDSAHILMQALADTQCWADGGLHPPYRWGPQDRVSKVLWVEQPSAFLKGDILKEGWKHRMQVGSWLCFSHPTVNCCSCWRLQLCLNGTDFSHDKGVPSP